MKAKLKKILLPEQNSKILKAIKKCNTRFSKVELINHIEINKTWFDIENIDYQKLSSDEIVLINSFLALKNKFVDGLIIGINYQSRDVFRQAIKWLKSKDNDILSSCFVVKNKNRLSIWGDCAFNPEPDLNVAKTNIVDMVNIGLKLKFNPINIGLLSYWTGLSNSDERTVKISILSNDLKTEFKNLSHKVNISDNIQFDAAYNKEICAHKKAKFQKPNVLWFPDLMCGNIGYKIAQHFGKLKFAGPFILGTKYCLSDLSRGATVKDIVLTIKIMSKLLLYRNS